MALPLPPRPTQPIPNNPFYYPEGNYIRGEYGPFIVGGGLFLDYSTGTISAGGSGPGGVNTILAGNGIYVSPNTGGIVTVSNTGALSLTAGVGIQVVNNAGNYTIVNTAPASAPTGTVTSITAGAGLSGGTITTSGTISLTTTGVGPGTYTNPTITVDAYGRVTYAAPGGSGSLAGVIATLPLRSNGLVPSTITIDNASTLAPGAVQLDDTVTSDSTTQAPTARVLKQTYGIANTATTNATSALAASGVAVTTSNNACSIANTAQTCALQALTNAAIAQGCANQALTNAAAAQTTANTALGISTSSQTTANTALASANNRIPCSAFLAKGNLLAGTSAGSYANLTAGTDGFVLAACAACTTGLTWVPAGGGGGTGTVTSITAGTGLNGGTITSSGTIDLADTAVTPGSYTYASIVVDQQGRLTSASDGIAPVIAVTGTNPISVTAGTTPDVSVAAASTATAGVVQLNDTVTSTSATQALTAAQGKVLQDQINALSVATNLTFAGTFDATLGHMDSVTTEGAAEGFTLGANLPAPSATNDNFFVIVTVEGTYSPPGGGGPYPANRGDWFLSNGVTWEYLNVGSDLPVASTGSQGVVELATVSETQAGTDTALAVTPAGGAATYVPQSCLSSKGSLITAAVAGAPITFPPGPNGYVLTSCPTGFYGLTWTPATCVTTQCTNPFNTTLGYCAMPGPVCSSIAANNVVIGTCAMYSNRCGYQNVAIGDCALRSLSPAPTNPIAGANVVVGFGAMCALCSGSQNVALGNRAADNLVTGNFNIAVGYGTLDATTSGSGNIAIGNNTMRCSTVVCDNTAVGSAALYCNTTGCYNVAIGSSALQLSSTGCRNIGIGSDSFSSNSTVSNEVTIWNGSVAARFQGAASSWSFVSDARDKTKVEDLAIGLAFVEQLKPRTFEWDIRRSEVDKGKKASGFIAQEVDDLTISMGVEYLNLVNKDDPDQYTLAQANLVPVLVKAIQELSAKVDELEAKLAANG